MRALCLLLAPIACVGIAAAQSLPELVPEPSNNTPAGAEVGSVNAQHYGAVTYGGDLDHWRVDLDQSGTLSAWTSMRGPSPIVDTVIEFIDTTGAILLTNDDEPGAYGAMSFAQMQLAAGTYFVVVRPYSAHLGDYALDIAFDPGLPPLGPRASSVFTSLAFPPAPHCLILTPNLPEVEPNDRCFTAVQTTVCTEHVNTLQVSGDSDFYSVTVTEPTLLTWETHVSAAVTGAAQFDTKIWLYDSACGFIGEDDEGGVGSMSRLELELPAGTYVLEVSHWQRRGTGDYRLTIEAATPDDVCRGTFGLPMVLRPRVGERPRIRSLCTSDVFYAPPGAVMMFGTQATPVIDLGVLGMPGCRLAIVPNLGTKALTPVGPNGHQEISLRIGATTGITVHMQAAALDVGANALGVILSDRMTWTVGV